MDCTCLYTTLTYFLRIESWVLVSLHPHWEGLPEWTQMYKPCLLGTQPAGHTASHANTGTHQASSQSPEGQSDPGGRPWIHEGRYGTMFTSSLSAMMDTMAADLLMVGPLSWKLCQKMYNYNFDQILSLLRTHHLFSFLCILYLTSLSQIKKILAHPLSTRKLQYFSCCP